ncbi:MAG: aminotransferase class IV [Nitrospirae bacterium]|nr:aminotransferase class IV [Nitrospirota bacterium]
MLIYLDDRLVDESEALVSVYDHGFLYGDGIYETMRAYGGVVFMIDEHMKRLERSASLIKLAVPPRRKIVDAVFRTLRANGLSDAYIRVTVSRGKGPIGLDPGLCGAPTLVIITEKFHAYPEAYYKDGVRLVISGIVRNNIKSINPKIKSLNFLNNVLAKAEAKERGAYEAIMLNSDGMITEGTVCNIFFVGGGTLCTPSVDAGILDGITRDIVIGLAKESGMEVKEGLFRPDDIFRADEVFFSNTTAEVMPVSEIEDRKYAAGMTAARLRGLYGAVVARYIEEARKSVAGLNPPLHPSREGN